MRRSSLLWFLPLWLVGCSAKDAVSLSVRISQANVAVQDGAFGSTASGSFQIQFTLGPEASGSTTVTPENFSLQTQSGQSLAPVLMVESTTTFPLVVDKGETKSVKFTFTGPEVDRAAACAGQVKILGSVRDSLKDATDPVQSDAITPSCEPAT